jgi:ABC-type spermidine/putrescine transport system permease subunit II
MQAIRLKRRERRPASFYWLALLFGLFVLFLYGPVITIFILSFQGPEGGLTFPMRGVSLHWFSVLRQGVGDIDIWGAFARSVRLALVVTVLTVLFSVAAGLAFRKRFRGDTAVFYVSVASLIMRRQVSGDRIGQPVVRRQLFDFDGSVHLGARRAPDVDLAVRPARDVRGVQPLQSGL